MEIIRIENRRSLMVIVQYAVIQKQKNYKNIRWMFL